MKTLLIFFVLNFLCSPIFSQKIIFVENQKEFDLLKKNVARKKYDDELNKGIWKNNSKFQKLLVVGIRKGENIGVFEEEISLNYKIYVNKNNGIDSLEYYFGKYIPKTEAGKTNYIFEYFPINSEAIFVKIERIFVQVIKKNTFYFNPMTPYEISGGLRINQFLSKSKGSDYRLAELLQSKSDTIKKLNLSNLGLKRLPKTIYNFKKLEELDLSKNEFEVFSFNAKKLPNLKRIILSENLLSVNSLKIKRNNNVQMINLSDNDFEAFPKKIQRNRKLKDLHLANNFIAETEGVKFKKMQTLELLNFYNNQISTLSEKIGFLKNLEVLDLYHNQLTFLPQNIMKLEKLETFAVSNNNLWEFPKSFEELTNLKVLYAHHNKLSSISFLPPNIENLDVGFNLIESVPESFTYAQKLTDLDISNNKIRSGANHLKQIPRLKKVYLALNDFESDPTKFAELQQIIVDLEKKSVKVK
ncbi:leucine-rich repeat domain-containing protein [Lacihabitans sp. CS3-21]|uniref:leucine-rich repeat domain-containing protein n=1 Tax=Lacihabitans sp. CS3-21 TaxID=2487332 RepID=UPI0020CEE3A4|nr:leucine-rich repeat domain-containing protein [Lacihabitans sp. CS3-21]MCP9746269.1 leucine-rich repeat domain-containing protein [Lacihabitans sp. CS3-21]